MRARDRWKKGSILLQTLIMSVMLSMIAIMAMRWVLARYIIANRVQESAVKSNIAQEYALSQLSKYPVLSDASAEIDGRSVSFSMTSDGGYQVASDGGFRQFRTTVDDRY
jgi:hypothetical protein